MTEFEYVGSELDLFAEARNWKRYWSKMVRPYISGDVLEVGAGIGSNTPYLDSGVAARWLCLEPDRQLIVQLERKLANTAHRRRYEVACGTLQSLPADQSFDTIVYIDVLEHIEDDRQELDVASQHLRPGGHIVVLSPAHQDLFTAFDASIGHYRRYSRPMLRAISPRGLSLRRLIYLDSVGLLASSANRLFLRQTMPTKKQLAVWDGWMIPASGVLDKLFGHSLGKSVVGVWASI